MRKVENQVVRFLDMKKEFNRAVDEAIAALKDIEERSKSEEWLEYAEEYGFDTDELMNLTHDRINDMICYYNRTYEHLYLDDIAYNPLDEIL